MRTSKRMPGTGRRSDRSVIHRRICGRATAPPPDDAKSGQKKETFPWSALSTSVGPITRRPTATPARAGDPDAADHQTRQEQQREQQAKTPAPAGVTVAAHKVAAPAAAEAGHAIPHDAAAEAVTPAKTPDAPREEEPDKLMTNLASSWKKTDGRAAMERPSRTGGTPAAAPGHRRLRDKGPHTLLRPTSGQPARFHGPQAGR